MFDSLPRFLIDPSSLLLMMIDVVTVLLPITCCLAQSTKHKSFQEEKENNHNNTLKIMTLPQTIRLLLVVLLVGVTSLTSVVNGFNVGNDARRRVQVVSSSTTSSSSLRMTILSYGGKKKNFKPGTPLSKALPQIGLKPKYSCKK